jgi:hypothetical protein
VGAGRLRWWSSGESRSDLNSRLHEQWQREQGEKGFLPQSERWSTIRSDDLSFGPAYDLHHAQLAIQASCRFRGGTGKCLLPDVAEPVLIDCECRPGFKAGSAKALLEAYDAEVSRGGWCNEESGSHPSRAHGLMPKNEIPVGLRDRPTLVGGNLTIVSCRHIPPHTGYIFQGEFNCALCAKEKAMENEVDVDTVQMGWAGGQVRVRRVPTLGEYEFLLVAGNRSGDYCFPGTLHPGEDLVHELVAAVGIRDAQGFVPKKIDLNAKSFEQLKEIVKATMRFSALSIPPPLRHEPFGYDQKTLDSIPSDVLLDEYRRRHPKMTVIGLSFVNAMSRLMPEEARAFTAEQFEERVDELLDLEGIVDRDNILVDESKLSPEEIRRLTNDHYAQHIKAIAPIDDHDKHVAAHLAAIINAPPPTVAGRVDLAEYLLKEKHVGVAEYLHVLETGRLPEEKEAVTLTSPTGDNLTMHFPKERDMATSSKMTIEEYRKEYGEPKHVGEDVFCKCCGQKAERTFGPAPYECRMGLRPNIEGWMKVFFPIRTTFEGVMQESFDVCTSCATKVSDYIAYVGKEKSGETGLSDEDLLADDA